MNTKARVIVAVCLVLVAVAGATAAATVLWGGTSNLSRSGTDGDAALARRNDEHNDERFTTVRREKHRPYIELYGSVTPRETVSIVPEVGGQVVQVLAEAGDAVHGGQVLAVLEDENRQIALAQAEIALRLAEQDLELAEMRLVDGKRGVEAALLEIEQSQLELTQRSRELAEAEHRYALVVELYEVGGVTRAERRAAEHERASAATRHELATGRLHSAQIGYRDRDLEAAGLAVPEDPRLRPAAFMQLHTRRLMHELDGAQSRLEAAILEHRRAVLAADSAFIRTPVSGFVGDRFLIQGERVGPQDRAFSILVLDTLEFVGELGEDRQFAVDVASEVDLFNLRDGSLISTGRVTRIAPYLDPSRRSRTIRVALDMPAVTHTSGNTSVADTTDTQPAAGPTAKSTMTRTTQILPGLLARARIYTSEAGEYLSAEKGALFTHRDAGEIRHSVTVLRGEARVRTPVEIIHRADDYVLFRGDVQVGEHVLLHGELGL